MSVSADSIYTFFERAPGLQIRKLEVASPAFAVLRRSVRRLVEILRVDPASIAAADAIHYSLLHWLSVPMPFASFDMSGLVALGSPRVVEAKWGGDARQLFVQASEAFSELQAGHNPLRDAVEEALWEAANSSRELRIFCHRTARQHFESLARWQDISTRANVAFLVSAPEYREAKPFETLLKIGPLRSRGFSGLPGAVLNAPRFHTLLQVVWHGTPDEASFGADPVLESWNMDSTENSTTAFTSSIAGPRTSVRRVSAVLGDTSVRNVADSGVEDDFSARRRNAGSGGNRRAVLFHLADGLGSLQAPHADIICLGVDGANVFASRVEPADVDSRYTHLVDPSLDQVDFGKVRAPEGRLAPRWKARLREEFQRSPSALEGALRARGINLDTLSSRIHEWAQPSTNVIHAPQQRRHFEILMQVLGIEDDSHSYPRARQLTWAAAAWAEVAHSRGEAIQHGTERQEIISEELKYLLNSDLRMVSERIRLGGSFTWTIPPGNSLTGRVRLHAIVEIESGHRCPDQLLRTIAPIERLLSWRE